MQTVSHRVILDPDPEADHAFHQVLDLLADALAEKLIDVARAEAGTSVQQRRTSPAAARRQAAAGVADVEQSLLGRIGQGAR